MSAARSEQAKLSAPRSARRRSYTSPTALKSMRSWRARVEFAKRDGAAVLFAAQDIDKPRHWKWSGREDLNPNAGEPPTPVVYPQSGPEPGPETLSCWPVLTRSGSCSTVFPGFRALMDSNWTQL